VKIALIPLDERPVNTRYPQMLARIAGAEVLLPPKDIRGEGRQPAQLDLVGDWLKNTAPQCTGVVASTEFLAYGNLINSRISEESAAECLPRLAILDTLGKTQSVYAFSLITRVSNADDCVEEPLYWKQYGTRFYQLSQNLHKREKGEEVGAVISGLQAELPAIETLDWLQRRLRNHTINLALLDLVSRDRLDLLLLTSDDTSPYGMPSREKAWLEGWGQMLGAHVTEKILIHPGADEVGSALVTRMLCEKHGKTPRICPLYAVAGGEEIVAPYEDRAVKLTVAGQINACGGVVTDDPNTADILLAVFPPSPRRTEWRESFAAEERQDREAHYRAFLTQIAAYNKPIAIGDVTYPNGSDPVVIDLLLSADCSISTPDLYAYGAWNTAGNTLGTTVAQAVCYWLGHDHPESAIAQKIYLTHRFLEDWGYQHLVRREARAKNTEKFGTHDPIPESPDSDGQVAFTCQNIEAGLSACLTRLQASGIGVGLHIVPNSTRLPWRRTFEADFDLAVL
jgi:hypothetical protein